MRKFIIAVYAALLGILLAVPTASADTNHVAQVSYVAPTYAAYDTVVIPKAFAFNVAQSMYLGVSDDARQLAFARMVAEEYAKIGGPHVPAASPAAAPQATASSNRSKIADILNSRCVSCHNGQSKHGDLSGDPDKISETLRLRSFLLVSTNKMPKAPKPPVPNDELEVFAAWAGATINK
jgi:mono/diheme cytochrome c family protein